MDRQDAEGYALGALGWILSDEQRAQRLLALTGLEPGELRQNLIDPFVLAAILEFLANYEADLIQAAEALNVEPEQLLSAKECLLT